MKNNAASVWNRTAKPVTVHFNSGFGGASQTVPAGEPAQTATRRTNTMPRSKGCRMRKLPSSSAITGWR